MPEFVWGCAKFRQSVLFIEWKAVVVIVEKFYLKIVAYVFILSDFILIYVVYIQ